VSQGPISSSPSSSLLKNAVCAGAPLLCWLFNYISHSATAGAAASFVIGHQQQAVIKEKRRVLVGFLGSSTSSFFFFSPFDNKTNKRGKKKKKGPIAPCLYNPPPLPSIDGNH
jgi:hypothetical protein